MLEKALRSRNVQKLRVALILETDFNAACKITFSRGVMQISVEVDQGLKEITRRRKIEVVAHLALSEEINLGHCKYAKALSTFCVRSDYKFLQ